MPCLTESDIRPRALTLLRSRNAARVSWTDDSLYLKDARPTPANAPANADQDAHAHGGECSCACAPQTARPISGLHGVGQQAGAAAFMRCIRYTAFANRRGAPCGCPKKWDS